jgi:hypothetical protein
LSPAAHTVPSVFTNSVWSKPAPIALTPVTTWVGLVALVVVPVESWPFVFRPQVCAAPDEVSATE